MIFFQAMEDVPTPSSRRSLILSINNTIIVAFVFIYISFFSQVPMMAGLPLLCNGVLLCWYCTLHSSCAQFSIFSGIDPSWIDREQGTNFAETLKQTRFHFPCTFIYFFLFQVTVLQLLRLHKLAAPGLPTKSYNRAGKRGHKSCFHVGALRPAAAERLS